MMEKILHKNYMEGLNNRHVVQQPNSYKYGINGLYQVENYTRHSNPNQTRNYQRNYYQSGNDTKQSRQVLKPILNIPSTCYEGIYTCNCKTIREITDKWIQIFVKVKRSGFLGNAITICDQAILGLRMFEIEWGNEELGRIEGSQGNFSWSTGKCRKYYNLGSPFRNKSMALDPIWPKTKNELVPYLVGEIHTMAALYRYVAKFKNEESKLRKDNSVVIAKYQKLKRTRNDNGNGKKSKRDKGSISKQTPKIDKSAKEDELTSIANEYTASTRKLERVSKLKEVYESRMDSMISKIFEMFSTLAEFC
uniref:Ulp1 protease family, C-terminal catalytic domain-containing protein n=1 Tax=Rhabditophanes sp. KR3021 TaxID=114890 RepID=A0AC35UBJ0_9BILA